MTPIGPNVSANISTPLRDHDERLSKLEQPGEPMRVYADPVATTAAELPPASAYPQTLILLLALNTLAWSDGSDWIRQDTQGALA